MGPPGRPVSPRRPVPAWPGHPAVGPCRLSPGPALKRSRPLPWPASAAFSARGLSARRCLPREVTADTSSSVSVASLSTRPVRAVGRPRATPESDFCPFSVSPASCSASRPACYRTSPSACGAWAPTARGSHVAPARRRWCRRRGVRRDRSRRRVGVLGRRDGRVVRDRRADAQRNRECTDPAHVPPVPVATCRVARATFWSWTHIDSLVSNLTELTVCDPRHSTWPHKSAETRVLAKLSLAVGTPRLPRRDRRTAGVRRSDERPQRRQQQCQRPTAVRDRVLLGGAQLRGRPVRARPGRTPGHSRIRRRRAAPWRSCPATPPAPPFRAFAPA